MKISKKIYSGLFPDGADKNKLQITDIGLYSITPPKEAEFISKIITIHSKKDAKNLVVTDATAGMGGNSISFAKHFQRVNAVEFSPLHCDILQHNINAYDLKNVDVRCADYSIIFNDLQQDVIFMDPPWGGSAYKLIPKLYLYLGVYPIEDLINKINHKFLVVVKAPMNLDLDYFMKNVKYRKIKKYKIRNYQVIAITGTP